MRVEILGVVRKANNGNGTGTKEKKKTRLFFDARRNFL